MRHTLFVVPLALVFAGGVWAAETDAEFVAKATRSGRMEVELSRHAVQHGSDAGVRAFGQRMVSDRSKVNTELGAIARRQGIAVPVQIDAEHREEIQELTRKGGADFDQAYMKRMVDEHVHDVDEFREQADDGKTEVDRFAAKTLPTLKEHLEQARTIEDTLDARGGDEFRGDHDAHERPHGAEPADDRP